MKNLKEFCIINLIVLFVVMLSNLFNFRICLFYNIFHIPCSGCGITRAMYLLIKGKIYESFQYSIMPIVIIPLYLILIIWNLLDVKRKTDTFTQFTKKYKKILILIATILTISIWIININNPLLY